jgi:predicted ArsR family transcriptional regulator
MQAWLALRRDISSSRVGIPSAACCSPSTCGSERHVERRPRRALAIVSTPVYSQDTANAVGIKRASIRKALESLVANADVIEEAGRKESQ